MFGNLQYFQDRDMGLALPMEIVPNFGEGEVMDASLPHPADLADENYEEVDNVLVPVHTNSSAEREGGEVGEDDTRLRFTQVSSENIKAMDTRSSNNITLVDSEQHAKMRQDIKGKGKIHTHSELTKGSFYRAQVATLVDDDNLVAISKEVGAVTIGLDKEILSGILMRDMLQGVVHGTLDSMIMKVSRNLE